MGKGGSNFVETIIKKSKPDQPLKVVNDEYVAPTYSFDLAQKLYELLATRNYGLYHIVNHGGCSWYEFAVKIFELLGKKVAVQPTTAAEFQAKAKRPKYSVLLNAKLAQLGLDDLRSWDQALLAYLQEKGYCKQE